MNKAQTLALCTLCLLGAAPAHATCTRADLTGSWRLYTVFDSVTRCHLVMPSSGSTIATTSSCAVPGLPTSALRGTLSIGSDCRVSGNITIGRVNRLVEAHISRGKDSIAGIGWQSGFAQLGNQFSGVRQ